MRDRGSRLLLACGLPLLLAGCQLTPDRSGQPDTGAATAPHCPADAGWDDPARPLRVHGNTWYVGTCGISALLVTSPRGHVLVDAGTARSAPRVAANIRSLGFRLEDIHTIVASHAHHDHAGGIAELQRLSGACVLARVPSVATMRSGRSDRSDPQMGVTDPFPAVARVEPLDEGTTVRAGDTVLTAHATPGHMPGATSWTWRSCEGTHCLDVAFVDSLTPLADSEYRFSDPRQASALAAFRHTLSALVPALPCDILLTTHPSGSDLWSRLGAGASRPLVARGACRELAQRATRLLDARLAQESAP